MKVLDQTITDRYTMYNGDSCEVLKALPSDSVHMHLYSPPFSSLYVYSSSIADMGNSKNDCEFFNHYDYLVRETYRTLVPGRLVAVHCKQLVNYKGRDGKAGLRDFRGEIIRLHQKHGFTYHAEILIWKSPVTEMQRTKSHGLLYKQLRKDSSYSRTGLPDYLLLFRKWANDYVDKEPVTHTEETFPLSDWQNYASPLWFDDRDINVTKDFIKNFPSISVWFDINQMNVLNCRLARDDQDEKHICPLQLDVVERAVKLWTNPGDIVCSPFAGIGSEGYPTIQLGRYFVGIELKESYYKQGCSNLKIAVSEITKEEDRYIDEMLG